MRDEDPDVFADAVAIERLIRTGFRRLRGEDFLHRSGVPLDEVAQACAVAGAEVCNLNLEETGESAS